MVKIHFHHSDDRFCGTTEAPRRFTFDPNVVSCQDCKNLDIFELTEQARKFLENSHLL